MRLMSSSLEKFPSEPVSYTHLTLPGFTSISMYPKLMEHEGYSYSALVDTLLQLAVHRRKGAY